MHNVEELNIRSPNTNPSSGRGEEKDLNSGPLDHKSSAFDHYASLRVIKA